MNKRAAFNRHYANAVKAFLPEFLQQRLLTAVRRGDFRFLAVLGYAIEIPSFIIARLEINRIAEQYQYCLIRGTSDCIRGTSHGKFNIYARNFSQTYNDLLFENYRQKNEQNRAELEKHLSDQDWNSILATIHFKNAQGLEDLELISLTEKN